MVIAAPDLVRAAMTATNTDSPTDLARALRMTSYSAPRNIKRWIDGVAQPDFDATLLLLQAAGLLMAEPQPKNELDLGVGGDDVARELREIDRKIDTVVTRRLEQLETAVRDLARGVNAPR